MSQTSNPAHDVAIRLTEYNERKHVRLSTDLFDVSKVINRLTSVHSIKLLYTLAQATQGLDLSAFVPIDIPLSLLFQYLGVEQSNKRYEYLRGALEELMSTPLSLVEKKKNGAIYYTGMCWIIKYNFSSEGKHLNVQMNPSAAPFLLQLSQYSSIQPINYNRLTTAYQTWFYPYLKDKEKLHRFRISIEDLKKLLDASGKTTYNNPMTGTNKFLNRVLGVTISEAAKRENTLAKKERRKPEFIPWEYVTDSQGHPTGTIYNINKYTDISVAVRAIKVGREYKLLEFDFTLGHLCFPKGLDPLSADVEVLPNDQTGSLFQDEVTLNEKWGWVVLNEPQIKELVRDCGMSITEIIKRNPSSLQMDDYGRVIQYKRLPIS